MPEEKEANPAQQPMPLAASMTAMEARIAAIQDILGTRLAAGDVPPIDDIEAFFQEWLLSSIVLGTDMRGVLPKMKMVMDISRRAADRSKGKKKITIDVLKKLIAKGNREKKKRDAADRAEIEEEYESGMREPEYRVGNG